MKEKDKRYRRKLRQYNVTFYLHEQKESDYFAGLKVSLKKYLMDKIREDMEKDGYKDWWRKLSRSKYRLPCFTIMIKKVSELSLRLRYAFRTCLFSMIKIFFCNVFRVLIKIEMWSEKSNTIRIWCISETLRIIRIWRTKRANTSNNS